MGKDYKDLKLEQIELLNIQKTNAKLKLRDKFKDMDWFFSFNNELPKNWIDVNILDVTWLVTCGVAKKPNYIEKGIPFLSAQNARPFKANLNKIKYISQEQFETLTVGGKPVKNDILYTRVGNCGEAAKVPFDFDFAVYVSLTLIKPIHQIIDSDFLVAFLNSYYGLTQANIGAIGSGLKNLNVNNVRRFRIPLPPLAEQQRIVTKLDILFGHLDSLKQRLELIPTLLKQFRQSVLNQAVTGKLTEEWREGKDLGEWEKITIGKLFNVKTGATPKRGNTAYYENANIPWLKSGQVKNELIYEAEEYITELAVSETNAKIYPKDTLLVAMYGEGKTRGQVGWMKLEAASNQAIAALVNEEMDVKSKQYVYYYCLSQYLEIRKQAEGGNQPNLNLTKIKNWKISLPSKQEQTEIVKRIEALFVKADSIEAAYDKLKQQIDSLPQAILAKAFKGELVEQLPTDGDAKELLKEIAALHASLEKVKKSKKKE